MSQFYHLETLIFFARTQGVTKLENATDAYVPIVWFEDGIEELDDLETIALLRSAVIQPALRPVNTQLFSAR